MKNPWHTGNIATSRLRTTTMKSVTRLLIFISNSSHRSWDNTTWAVILSVHKTCSLAFAKNLTKSKEALIFPESCLCPKSLYSDRIVSYEKISQNDTSYKFRLMNTSQSSNAWSMAQKRIRLRKPMHSASKCHFFFQ